MLTVEEIKNNLRIDYDEDDNYLEMLLNAAEMFIVGAIELDTLPEDPRTDVLLFMLVSLWYENRVPATNTMQQQVPFTINAMIHQLRGLPHGEYIN
ncbi:MAG: head-tail connector protein [Bacteriophage sp.]|nr:MAG: head-tail connector protein [Bacteriophage sp.]UVM91544.1 MAG: head-tail connector protein [Bacteriophage sp.]UVN01816.1 MAG: head-tail connector protein [Bacteriophage sp.]UVX34518.1 MAG: head-tail connector protein [Bacteriophage sp.]UVX36031.1 MAG: head-tail connector protein [Bacteriophage sp.]